jgi:hypothetical protein
VVAQDPKAYLVLSKESSLRPETVLCEQDILHYASLPSDEHLPPAYKGMAQKIQAGTAPAPNALCFEIKPQQAADFIKIDENASQQNFDIKFKVYGLSKFVRPSDAAQNLWCEVYLTYRSGGSPSESRLVCKNDDASIGFRMSNLKSQEQKRRDLEYADPNKGTFNIQYVNDWGYDFAYLTWGDGPGGIKATEAPARFSGVVVVDTVDPTDPMPSRTLMPVRLRLRSHSEGLPVNATGSYNLNEFNKDITEGVSLTQNITLRSNDPDITPILNFKPRNYTTSPNKDYSNEFTQSLSLASDSIKQDFVSSATFNDYTQGAWSAPHAVLKARSYDRGGGNGTGALSTYMLQYTSPIFKDAHKEKYPWSLVIDSFSRFQMPMMYYSSSAASMVPDIFWDNDNNVETPKILLARRASSFEEGAGGAELVSINIQTSGTVRHHEYNKAPCIVDKSFMPASLGAAGAARGTYCPSVNDLTAGTGASGYPGSYFYNGSNGRIGLDVTKNHKLVESSPGSGDFDTLQPRDLIEGDSFRVQFGIHDPNVVEGVEVETPFISKQPPGDSRFSYSQDALIEALTLGPGQTPQAGVTTRKDASGLSAQTEYAFRWTLQDVHIPKIAAIDNYDFERIGSPPPHAIIKVQDRGVYPAPMNQEFEMRFHGWDINNAPQYRGILYSSMQGFTQTEFRYSIDPSASSQGYNEIIFAASDEDRGDEVFLELLNPESYGFIPGQTIFIEMLNQDSPMEIAGKTCANWFSERLPQTHPKQALACLYVKFIVTSTAMSSMVWNLRVWDKPWWQRTDVYGNNALAYYPSKNNAVSPDPGYAVRSYSIPLNQYETMHPSPDLIQESETYVSLTARVGGSGFLLQATPMRVAYLGEEYNQTFYFFSPEENPVTCELTSRPQLSDTIRNVVLPASGKSLSPEETASVEVIATQSPHITGCKVSWKPILPFWATNQDGMNIGINFYEAGFPRGQISYTLNPDSTSNPLDAFSSDLDGVRSLENSIFNTNLRPDTHLANIQIATPNSETNGFNNLFTGSELNTWTFSYNKSSVEKSNIYPVVETWYLDGIPVAFDSDQYQIVFDAASAGVHTITLRLFDGGSQKTREISRNFYVRNSAMGVRSMADSFFVPKPGFNANTDRVDFMNLIAGFDDKTAVVSLYNKNSLQLELSAITFANTGPRASRAEAALRLNHLALLENFDIGIHGIGLTNSAGPSTQTGLFAQPQFHTPLFLSIDENGYFNNSRPRDSTQELWGLFGTKYENVVGLSKTDLVEDSSEQQKALVLTNDTGSTFRNATTLWVQPPLQGTAYGFLTFGDSQPEQIFDFRAVKLGENPYVLALTSSGLYIKAVNGSNWYTPWNFATHGYTPTSLSAGTTKLISSPENNRWGAGRLLLDPNTRMNNAGKTTVGVWVWKSSDKASKFIIFDLNSSGAIAAESQKEIENFPATLKALTGGSQWPIRNLSYLSERAKAAMFVAPDSSATYTVDFAGPTLRLNMFSFAGSRMNALSCHKQTDTCFAFDAQSLNLWRLR